MTKKEQLRLINETWQKINRVLSMERWGNEGEKYLKENIREEKKHDSYRPQGINRGISILQAGKLFAVKRIIEALTGKLTVEIKEYLTIQKSAFYAVALVENYRESLIKALEGINFDDVLSVDYVKLVEDKI